MTSTINTLPRIACFQLEILVLKGFKGRVARRQVTSVCHWSTPELLAEVVHAEGVVDREEGREVDQVEQVLERLVLSFQSARICVANARHHFLSIAGGERSDDGRAAASSSSAAAAVGADGRTQTFTICSMSVWSQ